MTPDKLYSCENLDLLSCLLSSSFSSSTFRGIRKCGVHNCEYRLSLTYVKQYTLYCLKQILWWEDRLFIIWSSNAGTISLSYNSSFSFFGWGFWQHRKCSLEVGRYSLYHLNSFYLLYDVVFFILIC